MNVTDPFASVTGGHSLAQAIVDSLREPFLLLDADLRVVAANRSFRERFGMEEADFQGHFIHMLGDGQWDDPELSDLLARVLPEQRGIEGFEFQYDFAGSGRRRILLNARPVFFEGTSHRMILLAMEDVTVWRAAETAMSAMIQEKELLLTEMQHRVANSLQIIASVLLIKARAVQSDETRQHLRDTHQRVISIAAVQEQLKASRHGDAVAIGPYLERLCGTLVGSMITESRPVAVEVHATKGEAQTSDAVSLGLIVTELLINAVKHAFPAPKARAAIKVDYRVDSAGWKLEVRDNGVGLQAGTDGLMKFGLGTSIVTALASKLGAKVETVTDVTGTRVSICNAANVDRLPALV
jgi:two-component sensor histidine kinase